MENTVDWNGIGKFLINFWLETCVIKDEKGNLVLRLANTANKNREGFDVKHPKSVVEEINSLIQELTKKFEKEDKPEEVAKGEVKKIFSELINSLSTKEIKLKDGTLVNGSDIKIFEMVEITLPVVPDLDLNLFPKLDIIRIRNQNIPGTYNLPSRKDGSIVDLLVYSNNKETTELFSSANQTICSYSIDLQKLRLGQNSKYVHARGCPCLQEIDGQNLAELDIKNNDKNRNKMILMVPENIVISKYAKPDIEVHIGELCYTKTEFENIQNKKAKEREKKEEERRKKDLGAKAVRNNNIMRNLIKKYINPEHSFHKSVSLAKEEFTKENKFLD